MHAKLVSSLCHTLNRSSRYSVSVIDIFRTQAQEEFSISVVTLICDPNWNDKNSFRMRNLYQVNLNHVYTLFKASDRISYFNNLRPDFKRSDLFDSLMVFTYA